MRIGVLGAGQLGMMLAEAAYRLALPITFLDPSKEARGSTPLKVLCADYTDEKALRQFVDEVDLVTYEFENVPTQALEFLKDYATIAPSLRALRVAQDRMSEKSLFVELGIPTPRFASIDSKEELRSAVEAIGLPAVLKTRRMGYDGKGQRVLRTEADLEEAWEALGAVPLILEQFIAFDREVSQVMARSASGQVAFYPVVENRHEGGILRVTQAPDPSADEGIATLAQKYVHKIAQELDYVGVLTVEFFEQDGRLYANEMAPRVHNSGHWTIEGAFTSQFENHLRAILDWPLGETSAVSPSVMVNLIGVLPDQKALAAIPGAHIHFYGKAPRPGRKVGHVTILAPDAKTALERAERVEALWRHS